jgi:hypothetical protein
MDRRRRWVRWMVVSLVVGVVAAFPALAGSRERDPEGGRPPLLVEVEYGDSLWTIAREHGDPNRDVREVVYFIRKANDVTAGRLQPGDVLAIPAECLPES